MRKDGGAAPRGAESPTDEAGEERLAARLRAGDSDAAREFYDRHAPKLHRFVRNALGAAAAGEADDVLQETLIALAEALPYFRGESSLFTFACSIAHRKVASFLRTRGRRQRLAESVPPHRESPDPIDGRRADVARALAAIKPQHREVLILKYVEELPVADVARALAIGERAAESRLARARRAFERALGRAS